MISAEISCSQDLRVQQLHFCSLVEKKVKKKNQVEKWNKKMGGRSCFITSGGFGDTPFEQLIWDAYSVSDCQESFRMSRLFQTVKEVI